MLMSIRMSMGLHLCTTNLLISGTNMMNVFKRVTKIIYKKLRAKAFWKDQAYTFIICVAKILSWWGIWVCTNELDKTWTLSSQKILLYCYIAMGYLGCTLCFLSQFVSAWLLGDPTDPMKLKANVWLSILATLGGISSLVTWKGMIPL